MLTSAKSWKSEPRRTRSLFIEIYETLNNLSPEFMKDLFKIRAAKRLQREKYNFNLEIPRSSQVIFVLEVTLTRSKGVENITLSY